MLYHFTIINFYTQIYIILSFNTIFFVSFIQHNNIIQRKNQFQISYETKKDFLFPIFPFESLEHTKRTEPKVFILQTIKILWKFSFSKNRTRKFILERENELRGVIFHEHLSLSEGWNEDTNKNKCHLPSTNFHFRFVRPSPAVASFRERIRERAFVLFIEKYFFGGKYLLRERVESVFLEDDSRLSRKMHAFPSTKK